MQRGRRRWIAPTVAIVAILVGGYIVTLIAGEPSSGFPLDPSSTDPAGTKAIVEIIKELGGEVDISRELPDSNDDVALVLIDTMSTSQRGELTEWMEAGGRVVLADPSSELAPDIIGETSFGLIEATLPRRCTEPAFVDVRRVSASGSFVYEVPEGATGCFNRSEGSWLVIEERGDGLLVSTGGPGFLTNGTIAESDNSILAVALLSPEPGTRLQFVRPPAPGEDVGGDESLIDIIPNAVVLALVQIALAFVVVVLWRMRRLGKPVEEPQEVTLAGSDLVVAVGDLMQQAGSRQRAADIIREDLRRDLSERLGVPLTLTNEALADAVAARSGVPSVDVLAVLQPTIPAGDADILRLAAAAEHLRARVLTPAR